MRNSGIITVAGIAAACCMTVASLRCGLFEPRPTEAPTQSGLDYLPATDPESVIANLQSAISQKNVANYISCFADPARTTRVFTFVPSAQYASVLNGWTRSDEQTYFDNLVHRTAATAFSNVILKPTLSPPPPTSDSAIYYYDYDLTFDHSVPNFPTTVHGSLQFSLAPGNDGSWMIYRWADFKTSTDSTWSLFKLKFSN